MAYSLQASAGSQSHIIWPHAGPVQDILPHLTPTPTRLAISLRLHHMQHPFWLVQDMSQIWHLPNQSVTCTAYCVHPRLAGTGDQCRLHLSQAKESTMYNIVPDQLEVSGPDLAHGLDP